MVKKEALPHYEPHHLTDQLHSFLIRVPLKGLRKPGSQHSEEFIDHARGQIHFRFDGVDQIAFYDAFPTLSFTVLTAGIGSERISEVNDIVLQRIEDLKETQHTRYKEHMKIFGRTYPLNTRDVSFRTDLYSGVSLSAPLIKMPRGHEGHLSHILSEHAYNVYMLPLLRFASQRGRHQPAADVWQS